jgi:hypothetical protein
LLLTSILAARVIVTVTELILTIKVTVTAKKQTLNAVTLCLMKAVT